MIYCKYNNVCISLPSKYYTFQFSTLFVYLWKPFVFEAFYQQSTQKYVFIFSSGYTEEHEFKDDMLCVYISINNISIWYQAYSY